MLSRFTVTLTISLAAALAQTNTGAITGLVTDAAGAVVPSAKVVIRETNTHAVVNTVTTGAGNYTAPGLPAGKYEVAVTAPGFKRASATGIDVRITQTSTQNITLQIGDVAESITVSADTAMINPNSSAVTTSVGEKFLEDLPFQDRSTLSVVLLTPGAQGDPQYNGGVQSELPGIFTQATAPGAAMSIGGGIPGGGSILVDGSDVSAPGTGRMVMTFSRDQVSEVSVQSNGIPAQYGRTTSAIINQATKSGTNQYHGNASWSHLDPYLQTQALGAAFPPTQHYDQAAIAIEEKMDRAWYGLGLVHVRQGRLPEALTALQRNTTLQPMSPFGWYQMARVHVELKQPEEAQAVIRHLKNFEPKIAAQLERETGLKD